MNVIHLFALCHFVAFPFVPPILPAQFHSNELFYADITLYNRDKERLCLRQLLSGFYGKLICLELDIKYIVYRD